MCLFDACVPVCPFDACQSTHMSSVETAPPHDGGVRSFQSGGERMMECYSEKLQEIESRDELSQRSEKVARLM